MKKQKSALLDQYVRSAVRGTKLKLALTATTGIALVLFGGDLLSRTSPDKERLADCTAKMAEAIHQNTALSQRIETQLTCDNKNKLADPLDIFYLETQKTNLANQAECFFKTKNHIAQLTHQVQKTRNIAYSMSGLGLFFVLGALINARPLLHHSRKNAIEKGTQHLYQNFRK